MQAFFHTLADRISEKWPDPAGLGPDVSDSMKSDDCRAARERLLNAEKKAAQAILLERQAKIGESLKTWRELFGPLFPLS